MQKPDEPFVVKEFDKKSELFLARNELYGDNYKQFGYVMGALFPGNKISLDNVRQMNRLGILVQIVSKLTRYAKMWDKGGHGDSLDDIAVYAMMLKELDHEQNS